jgi:hypothetical protein
MLFYGRRKLTANEFNITNTVSYNASVFKKFPLQDFLMPRMEWLINAVYAIQDVTHSSNILLIGPRSENDIFLLRAKGASNITALDLIGYSPLVTLGDMHDIPFNDDTFDVIIIGWTLPYTTNPLLVLNEIIRVSRMKSYIAIGFEHVTTSTQAMGANRHRTKIAVDEFISFEGLSRINCIDDINTLLSSIESIHYSTIFSYDHLCSNLQPSELYELTGVSSSQVMAVYCIDKAKNPNNHG